MGRRDGLDRCGKTRPPTGIRCPDRPARSEPLYRLSYPDLFSLMYSAKCYLKSTPRDLKLPQESR